jgi:hypothetical protein
MNEREKEGKKKKRVKENHKQEKRKKIEQNKMEIFRG